MKLLQKSEHAGVGCILSRINAEDEHATSALTEAPTSRALCPPHIGHDTLRIEAFAVILKLSSQSLHLNAIDCWVALEGKARSSKDIGNLSAICIHNLTALDGRQ